MNENLRQYELGMRYRIEVTTANLGKCDPEFALTKSNGKDRVKALRASGYVPRLFEITTKGGLVLAG